MFGALKQVTMQCYVLSSEGIRKYCFLYIIPHHKQREFREWNADIPDCTHKTLIKIHALKEERNECIN
jgi:hypothetical protein